MLETTSNQDLAIDASKLHDALHVFTPSQTGEMDTLAWLALPLPPFPQPLSLIGHNFMLLQNTEIHSHDEVVCLTCSTKTLLCMFVDLDPSQEQ